MVVYNRFLELYAADFRVSGRYGIQGGWLVARSRQQDSERLPAIGLERGNLSGRREGAHQKFTKCAVDDFPGEGGASEDRNETIRKKCTRVARVVMERRRGEFPVCFSGRSQGRVSRENAAGKEVEDLFLIDKEGQGIISQQVSISGRGDMLMYSR